MDSRTTQLHSSSTQWFQMTQNLPKIRLQNSWNCLIIFVQAWFWQIISLKGLLSPETEIYVIKSAASLLRNREIKWIYFWRILAIWNHNSSSELSWDDCQTCRLLLGGHGEKIQNCPFRQKSRKPLANGNGPNNRFVLHHAVSLDKVRLGKM